MSGLKDTAYEGARSVPKGAGQTGRYTIQKQRQRLAVWRPPLQILRPLPAERLDCCAESRSLPAAGRPRCVPRSPECGGEEKKRGTPFGMTRDSFILGWRVVVPFRVTALW